MRLAFASSTIDFALALSPRYRQYETACTSYHEPWLFFAADSPCPSLLVNSQLRKSLMNVRKRASSSLDHDGVPRISSVASMKLTKRRDSITPVLLPALLSLP